MSIGGSQVTWRFTWRAVIASTTTVEATVRGRKALVSKP